MGVKLIKLIDRFIGNVLCLILAFFNTFKRKKVKEIKNILVIQFWGIGETVLTIPAIKALRLKFPKAKITILATSRNKDVYECSGNYDKLETATLGPSSILAFIIKNHRKFDLVVDMEEYLNVSAIISFFVGRKIVGYSHSLRSLLYTDKVVYNDKQHVSKTFLDLVKYLGAKFSFDKLDKLDVSKKDKTAVDKMLARLKLSKCILVGIAPGSAESARSRMWPEEKFAKLADALIEKHKAKVVFVGAGHERNLIGNIKGYMKNKAYNLAGTISLKQAFYLISKCDLFISNDTGPMHIAAAQGVKTIGLFGPNLPERFGPFGARNKALYKGKVCDFSPCINVHKGQVPDCLYSRRSDDYQKCMKAIHTEDVLKAVNKLI